jgi:hypothetical protein
MTESSPIFARTQAFMLWLLQHTAKFPKNERFRLAKQLIDAIFNFHACLLALVYDSGKEEYFIEADIALAKIRTYGRLSQEMALTSMKQYEYFASQVTEIGRLLGGWKKKYAA